jgi:glycosyltransferase involved in cell wall biosynthesis
MRIGVLIPNLDARAGGSYTFVECLVNELSIKNINHHEVVFLTTSKNSKIKAQRGIETLIIPSKYFSRVTRLAGLVALAVKALKNRQLFDMELANGYHLSKFLKSEKIDMVWSLEPLGFPLNMPYATTHWDLAHRVTPAFPEFSGTNGEWKRREKRNKSVLQRATLICTGTQQGFHEIQSAYGVDQRNSLIVPMPVKQQVQNHDLRRDENLFIYPAQFWPHKNHITLLKAFHGAIVESGIDLKLVLTGSNKGIKEKLLSLTTELDLNVAVSFPGFVTEEDLAQYYKKARMMLFPSHLGPDNIPPLEAMSYGCPVAVSDVLGAREQYGDAAIYFDPNSVEEIKQVILRAARSPESDGSRVGLGLLLAAKCSPANYINLVMQRFNSLESQIWNFG